ncbi:uncharacterized protein LOC144420984 [Styela clava]
MKREMEEKSTTDASLHVAAFDLQKTLLCPHGQVSFFYYTQRLKNFNFTVTDIQSMQTSCYLWNEVEGRKGSCEIATAVFRYLSSLTTTVKTVQLFCDRCSGQNNNRAMIVMLLYAMEELHFDEIALNFLITGHSQNENDTAHSVIERAVRKVNIYTTDQWKTAISMAFKKTKPEITLLKHGDFVNFKSASDFPKYAGIWKNNITIQTGSQTGERLYWSKILQAKLKKTEPSILQFKYSYLDEELQRVDLNSLVRKSARSATQKIQNIEKLPQLYQERLPVSSEKYKSLTTLCNKNLIPPNHKAFYEMLPVVDES